MTIHLHSIRHADHFRADVRVGRRVIDDTTEQLRDELLVLRWPISSNPNPTTPTTRSHHGEA